MVRYARAGLIYDALSLELVLYRRPRRRLLELLGPLPGATVVDLGCGTGLNFSQLRELVAPGGTVIGIDASASMLAAARRRIRAAGWSDVRLGEGDVCDLPGALQDAGVDREAIGGIVASFVLSLLHDDAPVWAAIDRLVEDGPRRVALADVGPPRHAALPLRPVFALFARLGGADPGRRPWDRLDERAADTDHEVMLGGHVHVAAGTCD